MEAWDFYKKSVSSMRGQFNTQRDAVSKRLSGMGYKPTDEKWISDMGLVDSLEDTEAGILDKSSITQTLKKLSSSLQTEAVTNLQGGLDKQLGRTASNWELKLEGV